MENQKVTARVYELRTDNDGWLGQVVLTSDGSFMSISDWGNFSYNWGSTGREDFREFIVRLNVDYFATKMFSGMCYVSSTVKIRKSAMIFAEKILPALQGVLKKEIESEKNNYENKM